MPRPAADRWWWRHHRSRLASFTRFHLPTIEDFPPVEFLYGFSYQTCKYICTILFKLDVMFSFCPLVLGNIKRLSYELHSAKFSSRWIKCFSTLYFLQRVCPCILEWFLKADKCSWYFDAFFFSSWKPYLLQVVFVDNLSNISDHQIILQ